MGVMDLITQNLAETEFANLPADVVKATKKQILDTIAAAVGGSTCSIAGEIDNLVDLIRDWGGKEESTIIAFGGKVPAPNAAFLNGILCVRLDYDDSYVKGLKLHPSRGILPAAMAMAERRGRVDGKKFLAAVALGHDLTLRVRQAVGFELDSSFGMVTNFLGGTAAAGKILGLNRQQFEAALGLTFHQISGAQSSPGTAGAGASVKGFNNGIAAKTAIISSLLAQRGFSASVGFLEEENKRNMYQIFFEGHYAPSLLTSDLGKVFMGLYDNQKEYPCCHGQHSSIEATLAILEENHIDADEITGVMLSISPDDYYYLAHPVEKKQNPQNNIETQFSLYWGVASAIIRGEVNIKNFSSEALQDTRIREMMRKISAAPIPQLVKAPGFTPAIAEVTTTSGRVYTRRIDHPYGSFENPMSYEDIAAKFTHCCNYSVRPISPDRQDRVIRMVNDIENVNDVSQIIHCLG